FRESLSTGDVGQPRRLVDRVIAGMGMGGGGMGTLQSLLAEMSGLKKPRGFFNRVVRRLLGMRPKPPPKYRILHIFATNRPDDFEYIERERHATAIHEACHAVVSYRLRKHAVIDMATIERRGDVGGFVSFIPLEDQLFNWKSEWEVDIMGSLASLAGERMFFDEDNS